jgi:pSer/pThr/pTyr-binding forkhead associated (FHA) protein
MDAFLEACGGTGPVRLEVRGPGDSRPERLLFHQPYVLIGRNPRADVVLEHPEVSRRHCYLQVIAGQLYCLDLQSRTGVTFQTDPVEDGGGGRRDRIQIGPYRIEVEAEGARAGPPPDGTRESDPLSARFARQFSLPAARLESVETDRPEGEPGARPPSACSLNRVLTLIGGGAACKVRLKDPGASLHYCALVRTTVGVWFVDLLPSAPVKVNRARVRCALLADGDDLRVGQHLMRLRYEKGLPALLPRQAPEVLAPRPVAPRIFSLPSAGGPMTVPAETAARQAVLGAGDPALRAVLDQVVSMQQQMYDQFHQVFALLPNLIVSLNKNHVEMIREELAQISRLTEQIKELRDRQARGALEAALPPPAPAPARPQAAGPAAAAQLAPPFDFPPQEGRVYQDPHAIHEVVMDYLEAFEKNRQGRWDKILKLLMANGK